MAPLIPPLDFSRSPDSFTTAAESPSLAQADSDDSLRSRLTVSQPPELLPVIESKQELVADKQETCAPLSRSNTVSSQRKKLVKRSATVKDQQLVKRTRSVKVKAPERDGTKDGAKSYRVRKAFEWHSQMPQCDIHAHNGAASRSAEERCKQSVIEGGGKVIDEFTYPGGFLYQMPPNTPNPIQPGNEIESGGHIDVSPWTHFPRALFNGLKLTPYGGAGEFLILPVPPHRSLPTLEKAWPRSCDDMTKKRVSLWLGEMARNYGSSVRYMS
ncbi:hypothetical protein LTR85_001450 [Meristemomyces frigidus]|nr:hypothetical protein LTR85_001450 [Meristemomyces frigidus]